MQKDHAERDADSAALTTHIIHCEERVDGSEEWRAPLTLRQVGDDRIVGRSIISWSPNLGSYGMGGYGFFGLQLAATEQFPEEWFVLTIFGASDWLLLDGRWMSANPEQWSIQRPLLGQFAGYETWDDLSPAILGATIATLDVSDSTAEIQLCHDHEKVMHRMELPSEPERLPIFMGTKQYRQWNPLESLRDAWIISQTGDLG